MMQRMFGTRPLGRKQNVGVTSLLLLLGIGCIDVGHESEIGCLKDMTEPGCTRGSGGSASGGKAATGGKAASGGVTTTSSRAGASGMVGTAGNVGYAGASGVAGAAGELNGPSTSVGSESAGSAGVGS